MDYVRDRLFRDLTEVAHAICAIEPNYRSVAAVAGLLGQIARGKASMPKKLEKALDLVIENRFKTVDPRGAIARRFAYTRLKAQIEQYDNLAEETGPFSLESDIQKSEQRIVMLSCADQIKALPGDDSTLKQLWKCYSRDSTTPIENTSFENAPWLKVYVPHGLGVETWNQIFNASCRLKQKGSESYPHLVLCLERFHDLKRIEVVEIDPIATLNSCLILKTAGEVRVGYRIDFDWIQGHVLFITSAIPLLTLYNTMIPLFIRLEEPSNDSFEKRIVPFSSWKNAHGYRYQ